jgi:hypothetical protein
MADVIGYKGEQLDLLIRQGATFGPVKLIFTNPNGTRVNLTETTFRAQVRKLPSSEDIGAEFVCLVTDSSQGELSIEIPAIETEKLSAGITETEIESLYFWDLEGVESGGRVVPYLYGDVKVFREITK